MLVELRYDVLYSHRTYRYVLVHAYDVHSTCTCTSYITQYEYDVPCTRYDVQAYDVQAYDVRGTRYDVLRTSWYIVQGTADMYK